MRTVIVLSILLLSVSPAVADSVKLGTQGPTVGETWTAEKNITSTLAITKKGDVTPTPMVITDVEKKKVEILAVKDGVATKARITYEKRAMTQKMGSRDKAKSSPIEGKTYTVTAGDPLTVEPSGEADEVRKEEKRFGMADRLRHAIAGKEYTKGKPVDLRPEDVRDTFGDSNNAEVTKFTLEYVGMVGKNARFTFVAAMKNDKQAMVMSLKGSLVVAVATSTPLEMDITGTMKSDDGKMKIEGTMTMTGRRTK